MAELQDGNSKRKTFFKSIICSSGTAQDRHNQYRFLAWTFVWALSFLAATWVLVSDLQILRPLAWLIALAPIGFGIGAVLAYMKFLRMTDELIRKMQLDGLAFGFGASLIVILGYQGLERVGAPQMGSNEAVLVMIAGWVAGQIIAFWRYQ